MKDSLFYSALRALLVAMFAIIGLVIGILFLLLIIGLLSGSATDEPSRDYSVGIVPNAQGVRKAMGDTEPVILRLNIDGVIGLDSLTHSKVERQLVESREGTLKDNRVKALLVYINTPGGTAIDADGIYRAIKRYKELHKVPVYAYVDGLCASGGMYVACACDKVYATDVSAIGSVGVILPSFFNVSELINKWGIQTLTLYAGTGKDELNPVRPWKNNEGDNVKSIVDYFYNEFVNIVATNRPKVDRTKLVNEYGAKLFNPSEAQTIGFIDQAGHGYVSALKDLLAVAGVKDDEDYTVVEMKSDKWFSELFRRDGFMSGVTKHRIEIPGVLDSALQGKFLYMYSPEGVTK